MTLDEAQVTTLQGVSTASITTILLKKGLRNVWMRGAAPAARRPGAAGRTGLHACVSCRRARIWRRRNSWSSPTSTRAAIEAMPEGCIAVVDAVGVTDAGIFGDILCARMRQRGVAALVTDGAVRDVAGVTGVGLPVWCGGVAAPPSVAGLTFVGWQEPIGCGGVAVFPDDVIVADDDGAVVIPAALLDHVWRPAPSRSGWRPGSWARSSAVRPLPGLYPPNAATRARYEADGGAS